MGKGNNKKRSQTINEGYKDQRNRSRSPFVKSKSKNGNSKRKYSYNSKGENKQKKEKKEKYSLTETSTSPISKSGSLSDSPNRGGFCSNPPEPNTPNLIPQPPGQESTLSRIVNRDISIPNPLESFDHSVSGSISSPNKAEETLNSTPKNLGDSGLGLDQDSWKGFPAPRFYGNQKKYYDPRPKSSENFPPNLYFPLDGHKLRKYKNYKPFNDPLSMYNDSEFYKKDFKDFIVTNFEIFKRKLEMSELEVEMASLTRS